MNKKDKKIKDEFLMQFGQHLKEVRKAKGLSTAELARCCYMDKPNLVRIESGRVNTSIYQIKKLCEALELDFEQFFKNFENK